MNTLFSFPAINKITLKPKFQTEFTGVFYSAVFIYFLSYDFEKLKLSQREPFPFENLQNARTTSTLCEIILSKNILFVLLSRVIQNS